MTRSKKHLISKKKNKKPKTLVKRKKSKTLVKRRKSKTLVKRRKSKTLVKKRKSKSKKGGNNPKIDPLVSLATFGAMEKNPSQNQIKVANTNSKNQYSEFASFIAKKKPESGIPFAKEKTRVFTVYKKGSSSNNNKADIYKISWKDDSGDEYYCNANKSQFDLLVKERHSTIKCTKTKRKTIFGSKVCKNNISTESKCPQLTLIEMEWYKLIPFEVLKEVAKLTLDHIKKINEESAKFTFVRGDMTIKNRNIKDIIKKTEIGQNIILTYFDKIKSLVDFILEKCEPSQIEDIATFINSLKIRSNNKNNVWNELNHKEKEKIKEIFDELKVFLDSLKNNKDVQKILDLFPDEEWKETKLDDIIRFDTLIWTPLINAILNNIAQIYYFKLKKQSIDPVIEKVRGMFPIIISEKLKKVEFPKKYKYITECEKEPKNCSMSISNIYQGLAISYGHFIEDKLKNQLNQAGGRKQNNKFY